MSDYDSKSSNERDTKDSDNSSSDKRNSSSYKRSGDRDGYRGTKTRSYFRKKVCRFCTQNYQMDYRKPETLQRFLTDRGKILPRRITGTCAKHQRHLATVIKRARALALLPFVKQ